MANRAELLYLAGISFVLSLVFTPLARALARRFHLVDRPDGHRKLHGRAVPLAGGIGIFLASFATLGLWLGLTRLGWMDDNTSPQFLVGLFLAAVIICLVGVADDYGYLRGRHKLFGQMIAILVVIAFGVQVTQIHIFGWPIELGLLSVPFTGFLLLAAINSLNLLDGMDGLLGSVGLVTCAGIAFLAALGGHWTAAAVAAAMAGAILGFLLFNLPPASVFLGDTGSMLIGLVVGVLAIRSTLKGPTTIALATPLALLTIPAFDTFAAIIRRKLTGRSLYTTDRGHLHHCLQRRGLSTRWILVLVGSLCLVTSVGALASQRYNSDALALLSSLFVISSLMATGLFGLAEAGLIHKRLQTIARSLLTPRTQRSPHQVEIRLQGSVRWQDSWNRLTDCAEDLQLRSVRLDVNAPFIGEGYHARWDNWQAGEDETLWRTDIPLVAKGRTVGHVQIFGERDHLCVSEKVAVIAQVVEEIESMVLALVEERETATHGSRLHARNGREKVRDGRKHLVVVDEESERFLNGSSHSKKTASL